MFADLFSLRGRVALIAGGSRGIGKMIAAGFIAQGAKVYIASRKAAACEATAAELSKAGGSCVAIAADASTVQGVRELAAALTAREPRLDILVNNAGAAWLERFDAFPEKGWDKVAKRIPARRIGRDEDMAAAAVYLASRAGDYVVGATLVVDGGVTCAR